MPIHPLWLVAAAVLALVVAAVALWGAAGAAHAKTQPMMVRWVMISAIPVGVGLWGIAVFSVWAESDSHVLHEGLIRLFASLAVSIAAAAFWVGLPDNSSVPWRDRLIGAAALGGALAGIYDLTLNAVAGDVQILYDPINIGGSLIVAFAVSWILLSVTGRLSVHATTTQPWWSWWLGSAIGATGLMAIVLAARLAGHLYRLGEAPAAHPSRVIEVAGGPLGITIAITCIALLALGGAASIVRSRIRVRLAETRALQVFARAGAALSSGDYETTLASVAKIIVPELADWCAIDLTDDAGVLTRVAVAHQDPKKVHWAQEMVPRIPGIGLHGQGQGARLAAEAGSSTLISTVTSAMLREGVTDTVSLETLLKLGLRSVMIVPLVNRGTPLGALTMVAAESMHNYSDDDLVMAEELGRRAGAAIDTARLLRTTLQARDELRLAFERVHRTNDALAAQTAAAQAANRTKSEFLAMMSHELRTPLNAIGGYTELLELGIYGELSDQQREALERLKRNQQHLLGIINDLLNFARLDAGRMSLSSARVSIEQIFSGIDSMIAPQASARGVGYKLGFCKGMPMVWADPERARQILINLLTNAIKFTASGGFVNVSCSEGSEHIYVTVEDNGSGIPEDQLGAIFEPFVQVEGGLTRQIGGTGLGLPISRGLARAMGGDLKAESVLGEGSRFTVSFRRAVDMPEVLA